MQRFSRDSAILDAEHEILIGRWSQYAGLDALPFNAMWCEIPPGGSSRQDKHPEIELAVVVNGEGAVETPAETVAAPRGTAVLLSSHEPHIVRNRSGESPLVLLSLYWLPNPAQARDE